MKNFCNLLVYLKTLCKRVRREFIDLYAGVYLFLLFGSSGFIFFCFSFLLAVIVAYACYGIYAVGFHG